MGGGPGLGSTEAVSTRSTLLLVDHGSGESQHSRREGRLVRLAARTLENLKNRDAHIIGFDFTPPPFRENFLGHLTRRGCTPHVLPTGILFEFTATEDLPGLLSIVNWTTTLVLRITHDGLDKVAVPEMRKRFMLKAPTVWYEEHLSDSVATCYFALYPFPGFEFTSTRLSSVELVRAYLSALETSADSFENVTIQCRYGRSAG
jgi:hypothetical protein